MRDRKEGLSRCQKLVAQTGALLLLVMAGAHVATLASARWQSRPSSVSAQAATLASARWQSRPSSVGAQVATLASARWQNRPPAAAGATESLLAPTQAHRLVATWTVPGAARLASGSDGLYVLSDNAVRRLGPGGEVLAEKPGSGLRELAVDSAGGLYIARAGDVQRWLPDGSIPWLRTIRGHVPSTLVGEVPPYLAALAWDSTSGDAWLLYDTDQTRLQRFPPGGTPRNGFDLGFPTHSYWDLDFRSGQAYVLNRTQATVEVYDAQSGVWQSVVPLPPGVERIALDQDSGLYAVAARRWVYQIETQGERTGQVSAVFDASDPTPGTLATAVSDVAVDSAGRIYVADPERGQVRVYEIDPQLPPPPTPQPESLECQIFVDKTAAPTLLTLGERTRVTLHVGGRCPMLTEKADIMLVLDHSNSMNRADASGQQKIAAARAAARTFVGLMDLQRDQVGLVIFESVAQLLAPLTQDRQLIDSRINTITAQGGTNIAAGIDVALAELTSSRRRSDAKPIIVLLSDGMPFNTTRLFTLAAADRARHAGVTMYTIGLGEDADQDLLRTLARSPGHSYFAPTAAELEGVYRAIARQIVARVLFKTVKIVDVVPENMQYEDDGTTTPPAEWDPGARTLTWHLADVPFAGIELSYWLRPLDTGQWPTNTVATYDGTDGLDRPQVGPFPIPRVVVVAPSPTPTITDTPLPTATGTLEPTASPTASPTATTTPTVPSPTPTTRPTATATPEAHQIYVIIVFNQYCFRQYADVVLVIDASTTMRFRTSDGQVKLDAAREAAQVFLDQLNLTPDMARRHDRAAIVWFNDTAAVAQGLTNQRDALDLALAGITLAEGSRIDLGLRAAHQELMAHRASRPMVITPAIVLLSDGLPNRVSIDEVMAAASAAKRDGIVIYTVGFGDDVHEANLRAIATRPELYEYAPSAAALAQIYRGIAGRLICR